MDAEVVMLNALPGRIFSGRPAVRVSDSILPVVAADKISARPAVDRRIELFKQLQNIRTESLDIVRRHERHCSHPERLAAAA